MESGVRVRARWLLALALVALAAAGRLAWQAWLDPDVPYLSAQAPGEWLTEASEPHSVGRMAVEREVVFRKRFSLERAPARASLRARVFRAGVVYLNGVETGVSAAPGENWKRVRERDVGSLLRPGENELLVRVRAASGPPALWLALEAEDLVIASDASWSAAAGDGDARPARLAATPMSAWTAEVPGSNQIWRSLPRALPWLGAFALAAALALLAARRLEPQPGAWLLGAFALAIGALVWHNRALDPNLGFDAGPHLDYVRFIVEQRRLPLASDGWSMYHPPLYYALSAAISALSDGSSAALRALNGLALLVQSAALLGALRILFPAEPRRVYAGFALGSFVPAQLYLSQFVTNEVWAAALASASLWLCLRILARDDRSARAHLALGALLGAALLTKVSALIVALAVIAVLCARLISRGERSTRAWLASVGSLLLAVSLVCGWHYARVAWHFGSPLVGNWDAVVGFSWWQDPGYRTLGDYLRFGESLSRPIFSAWHGCPDALYSTLWGDGLIGGASGAAHAPPWRYPLMVAGYWLALVPSAGVLVGIGLALARLVREPSADWLLLLAVAGGVSFALVSLSLDLPYYAQCKAFYGLSALLPFAALGGLGLDRIAARLGRAQALLWIVFGAFLLCAYASYWSV